MKAVAIVMALALAACLSSSEDVARGMGSAFCAKSFECDPIDSEMRWGTFEDCKAGFVAFFKKEEGEFTSCSGDTANACSAKLNAMRCVEFLVDRSPAECECE